MAIALSFLKKTFSWDHFDMQSLLHYYRYISLMITSIFYFLGPPFAPFYLKLSLVIFLFIEAWVFIKVFREINSAVMKKVLIFIELIGLLIVLLLTGGLDSPFLWYAVNPVLLSVTLAPAYFCWASAIAFIVSACYLQRFIAGHPEFSSFIWPERAYIFLIFTLIIFSAQLSNHLVNKLSWQKAIMEKQLGHIKSLYEAAEIFTHHSDPQEVANLFASYSKALTGATKSIIWAREMGTKGKLSKVIYAVKGPKSVLLEQIWYPYIKNLFEDENNEWKTDVNRFPPENGALSGTLITVRIKSSTNLFGVLSAYYSGTEIKEIEDIEKTLVFLADLCAASLEKRYLESMADKLLLAEEKDRIARQIHDTVNQTIFGLIHGLNTINRQYLFPEEVSEQLSLLQKTAHKCLHELKHSIYNLSGAKSTKETFEAELKGFFADFQKLNNVETSLSCHGNFKHLDSHARSALFRIIREASSNAVRHGGSEKISITLQQLEEGLSLVIKDDGKGFNEKFLNKGSNKGLGLLSMKELASSIGGELTIISKLGNGTEVVCKAAWPEHKRHLDRKEVLGT